MPFILRSTRLLGLTLPAILAAAQPAHAQAPTSSNEALCLAAYFKRVVEEEKPVGFLLGFLYFLGKIAGRDPNYDVKSELRIGSEKLESVNEDKSLTLFRTCADEVHEKGFSKLFTLSQFIPSRRE